MKNDPISINYKASQNLGGKRMGDFTINIRNTNKEIIKEGDLQAEEDNEEEEKKVNEKSGN